MEITLDKLERQRTELVARVDGWSAARLNQRPATGAWSAIEMFDHLAKTEEEITAASLSGVQAPHAVSVLDRVKFAAMEKLFTTGARVKVPPAASMMLPGMDIPFAEIGSRWSASREQIAILLRATPRGSKEVGVFRHPVSGWMTVPQVLRFFSVHMVHHGFQLNRIAAASRKM